MTIIKIEYLIRINLIGKFIFDGRLKECQNIQ